jgi:NADP-dependent aldehyde dehydrogenase
MIETSSKSDLNATVRKAQKAFAVYRNYSGKKKAAFLEAIAQEIEALGDDLLQTAARETHLPIPRLTGERGRTMLQLRLYADLIKEGSWVDARIDTAMPDRQPAPRPDLRGMLRPIGPVVVFGSSNFPFAYSTAGGDTASALATGCPVIVKAHPAHSDTSDMVASAILKAAKRMNMPDGVFGHVHGGIEAGKALVKHPSVKAVGFTGSFSGGKALFDLANKRKEPIPVFAEMGSVNPVFIFDKALQLRGGELAQQLADSVTLGMGQFCTNPGLIFGVKSAHLTGFIKNLSEKIDEKPIAPMLHEGISKAYNRLLNDMKNEEGVTTKTKRSGDTPPSVMTVEGSLFLKNKNLHKEVFGPSTLVVQCDDWAQVKKIVGKLEGQLTASLMAEVEDLKSQRALVDNIIEIGGRINVNNVPTGVEVVPSMQHGGPFPSTTDSRFTSVGTGAVFRWVRPVCYQNFPDELLPDELKENNPMGIRRTVNGVLMMK